MDLCVAPVVENKAKQIGLCPVRRTLSSSIALVYPCATHGPDVVRAVKVAADRATHLASTRGNSKTAKSSASALCQYWTPRKASATHSFTLTQRLRFATRREASLVTWFLLWACVSPIIKGWPKKSGR